MPSMKTGLPLKEAKQLAISIIEDLGIEAEVTGSLLREEKFIGDIDLLVLGDLSKIRTETDWEVISSGENALTFICDNQQVNLFKATPENIGAMRMTYTGPKYYVIAYRVRAKKRGWLLNQYGLWDEKGNLLESRHEEKIYELLGKTWKHPKYRGRK